ncbi:ABC transporter permease [Agrobacterium rhizogenes]|nr:ABC transporter permease [Rhizobium rhizogenes]NTG32219.1 ABC transporter permease [Rhizobium rhizogenes]
MSVIEEQRRVISSIGTTTQLAGLCVALLVFVAIFGPSIAPYNPLQSSVTDTLQPPSWQHWAGTDQIGRDVLSRLLVATRLDMLIAMSAVLLSFLIGSVVGAFVGYFGGWPDKLVGRVVDMLMAFPLFVLAMLLIAAVGTGVANIIYATAAINLPFYVRVARSEVNARRDAGWVEAARLSGNGHVRIILFFLMPNILPVMMVQISINLGWAILNAAALSFLGLGVQPPTPEWGIMVAEGAQYIPSGNWWLVAFPGAALMLAVLSFNLLGDAMRDFLDPRKRQ